MSTAYAPRITATDIPSSTIPDDAEAEVATIGGISSTNVQTQALVEGLLQLGVGPDTSALTLKVYVGDLAGGDVRGNLSYNPVTPADAINSFPFTFLIDLGPDEQGAEFTVTATCTDASDASSVAGGVLKSTVF